MFCVDLTFVFLVSIFIFCLESTLGKDTWMRAASVTVMVIFLKVPFWKLLDHNYIQSSFSTIARYIDNSILKETLKLKILRTWIKIHANSFIKTWVNIKWKSIKVPWKLSVAEKYNPAPQRALHQSRWYFAYCNMRITCFFFLTNKPNFYI